jgi:hypothetical protein
LFYFAGDDRTPKSLGKYPEAGRHPSRRLRSQEFSLADFFGKTSATSASFGHVGEEMFLAAVPVAGIIQVVGRIRTMFVTLLLAIWPAVTSHTLLEQAGMIHVVHDDHHGSEGSHEHNADNHAFADGDYTSASAANSLKKPGLTSISTAFFQRLYVSAFINNEDSPGPAPPGIAPPFLQKSWYFLLRTALPVRAPSFIS